jgi:phytoene synthase
MKQLFDSTSAQCSALVTKKYSTSFSLGIRLLGKHLREPICGIYGFVRFADEIVDSFHEYDRTALLQKFRNDTVAAIEEKISLNPILNSFQKVVHDYKIEWELIDTFLKSMEMDLIPIDYDKNKYEDYILGSAEVVGLMCLRVFVKGDESAYLKLKPHAMSLGAAFQKVNFLRDVKMDFEVLGRIYFPGVNMNAFDTASKKNIEREIENNFRHALEGIRLLPLDSRMGVYLAFRYYKNLLNKIKSVPPHRIMNERVRVPDVQKLSLIFNCFVRYQLNVL